ncbi:hypothetical protein EPUL_004740, partial [Erysiphe pulchra]
GLKLIFPDSNSLSIGQDLSNFITGQARLNEAQRVVKQFTTLYESIHDPEIRSAMETAAVGIKENLRMILTGNKPEFLGSKPVINKTKTPQAKEPQPFIDLTTTKSDHPTKQVSMSQRVQKNRPNTLNVPSVQTPWTKVAPQSWGTAFLKRADVKLNLRDANVSLNATDVGVTIQQRSAPELSDAQDADQSNTMQQNVKKTHLVVLTVTAHTPQKTPIAWHVLAGCLRPTSFYKLPGKHGTDVLLLQEPWASKKDNERLTKSHPGYEKHTSVRTGTLTERQRAIIYTRKGGDFNAVHPDWQPLANRQHGDGQGIIEWMIEHGMNPVSPPGIPTYTRGNTLDLVWSNYGALVDLASELNSTSDHFTLSRDVPLPNSRRIAALKLSRPIQVKDCKWSKSLRQQPPSSPRGVDNLADNLVKLFGDAIRTTGRRDAFADKTDAEMYRLAHWVKPRSPKVPPLIRTETGTESNPERRATLLCDLLLARYSNENDVMAKEESEDSDTILPWETIVTEEEAKWATTACKEKAPGADGITVQLIREAWPVVGEVIRTIFEGSLNHNHFPSEFKLAEVILLPKPGRYLSEAKGWRPISLLSYLGKGLERLIAKRIAYMALTKQITPYNLFGALLGRSAHDLIACVVHDLEHTLSLRKKVVLVILDVQGAFDAVLHERLLQRMQGKGWSKQVRGWIHSFLKNRMARVRYENGFTAPKTLEHGLSQGSPLSPILFLLYISEIVARRRWRFGHADDIAVLGIGKSPEEAAAPAQQEVDDILTWARTNAVSFDPTKTEGIYFLGPRAKTCDLPPIKFRNDEIRVMAEIRWLGIYLDRGLSFRRYIAECTSKGLRLVQHLRRIASCKTGPSPGSMVTIIRIVLMPTILHAAGSHST